jgi:hypothetical protein
MTTHHSRLYENNTEAQRVIADLRAAGIAADDISLIANQGEGAASMPGAGTSATAGAGLGAAVGGGAGLLTGLGIMAIPGVGPVVAAGWIASTLAGVLAGAATGAAAGGLVGAFTENGIDERDAHVFAEGVRRGGSVVLVKTDETHRIVAEGILDQHMPVGTVARRTLYEAEGWNRFDDHGGVYVPKDKDASQPAPRL